MTASQTSGIDSWLYFLDNLFCTDIRHFQQLANLSLYCLDPGLQPPFYQMDQADQASLGPPSLGCCGQVAVFQMILGLNKWPQRF